MSRGLKFLLARSALIGIATPALAAEVWAQERLTFDRNDPAIVAFRPPDVAAAGVEIPSLDIPVVGFSNGQPSSPAGAIASAAPPPKPQIIYDRREIGADRGWYTLRYELPELLKVTVSGDLNVQSGVLPTDLAPAKKNSVTVIPARKRRSDDEAPIARIVITRFPNVPYVADVTCRPAAMSVCASESKLRKLASELGLLSVPR
jgi:hypothetical protein